MTLLSCSALHLRDPCGPFLPCPISSSCRRLSGALHSIFSSFTACDESEGSGYRVIFTRRSSPLSRDGAPVARRLTTPQQTPRLETHRPVANDAGVHSHHEAIHRSCHLKTYVHQAVPAELLRARAGGTERKGHTRASSWSGPRGWERDEGDSSEAPGQTFVRCTALSMAALVDSFIKCV